MRTSGRRLRPSCLIKRQGTGVLDRLMFAKLLKIFVHSFRTVFYAVLVLILLLIIN